MARLDWFRRVAATVGKSPVWKVARFVLIGVAFFLAWTGWTGPELLSRLGGDFFSSDVFRTLLVVFGLLLVVAIVLVPAAFEPEKWVVTYDGRLVPRNPSPEGYTARSESNEAKWWLVLERPSAEEARFIVTVRHESGAAAHTEFWQEGATITVWYPDQFEARAMPVAKPWGEYAVSWDVFPGPGGHDVVEDKFTWGLENT